MRRDTRRLKFNIRNINWKNFDIRNLKLDKYAIRRIIAIVLIILMLLLIKSMIGLILEKNKYKDLSILLNNELMETEKEVMIDENNNIYFSKSDIQKLFDETIYYNEADKELITTYNKHIAKIKLGENTMIVNDSTVEINAPLIESDGEIYIPIKDFEIVYDLEIQYVDYSNRIIMDSTNLAKTQALVIKKTKVKKRKGLFSKKVDKLALGDKIVVIETVGNYKKIRTPIGNIGFIKKSKIADETVLREEMKEEKQEIKVYSNYSNISGIYDKVSIDTNKLNVVIPTFFQIDKNNKVLDKTTSSTATYANYMNWVNDNKLEVLPTLKNNQNVSSTLLTYDQRNAVINSLYEQVIKYQFKGVNINFETIDDINSFYRFVIEIVPKFKESGLIVAVTMNDNLDKEKLVNMVDYVIEK